MFFTHEEISIVKEKMSKLFFQEVSARKMMKI